MLAPFAEALRTFQAKALNPATVAEYQRLDQLLRSRMDAENTIGLREVILATHSKNTLFKRLAAVQYMLLSRVAGLAASLPMGEATTTQQALEISWLQAEWQELLSINPTQLANPRRRQSKRRAIRGLPDDWREQLCLRMGRSKYRDAVLVMALSGCRPAELVKGVRVTLVDEQHLRIDMQGAKVTQLNGQPHRMLILDGTTPTFLQQLLLGLLQEQGGSLYAEIDSAKNLTKAITRYAQWLWPKHRHDITAYCFRHGFSSDQKGRLSPAELAACLGHRSTRTQKRYGQRQQSKGRHSADILKVAASYLPRQQEPHIPPSPDRSVGP